MYYPEEIVEEIRMKNDIVDVISGYVRLQRKGGSHFGLCPFHNEKSPSFSVSQSKQMYYCFGCGAGGNVYTFLMEYEHYTFPEAVRALAERAGVDLPEAEYSEEMKRQESRRAQLLQINKEAAKYFYYLLRRPGGEQGMRYLQGRMLSAGTIGKFGLGYAGKYRDDLTKYLKGKGWRDELLQEAGLCTIDEKYGTHDKFWNRVMFPIQDINHRVIGFGGRVMGEGTPKYLNSPETPVFDKSRNLYGLNLARTSRAGNMILCEGYMDVIAMHQAGFGQAVASLGTAFTEGQAALLRRYTRDVLLAYDSDGAGVKAALRAIGILRTAGLTGRVISLEPYKDPDELVKNLGAEELQKRIDRAENSFFFELRILERDFDLSDPEGKTRFQQEAAKKLCGFAEELERENYIEATAEKYRIGFEKLRNMVNTYAYTAGVASEREPAVRPKSGQQRKASPEDGIKKAQRLLLTWLSEDAGLYRKVKKYIAPEDFTTDLYRQVAQRLFADLETGCANPAAVISQFADEEQQREAASLFHTKLPLPGGDKREREKAFHDILVRVKTYAYERDSRRMERDADAINRVIRGKKALEELKQTHISLD